MDAFDADVLIYAATPGLAAGRRVRALLDRLDEHHGTAEESPADAAAEEMSAARDHGGKVGVGSVLLIPEVFIKPRRQGWVEETEHLSRLLRRLDLLPVDREITDVATVLGARYGLRAPDAIHLATAVVAGADRFITANRKDFTAAIDVIEIAHPEDLG